MAQAMGINMGSKKFGGLNIEELDQAAALESKTAEPKTAEPKTAELKNGSLRFGGLNIDELDQAVSMDSKPAEPVKSDPADSRFREWVEPTSVSNPGNNSSSVSSAIQKTEPVSVQDPTLSSKQKPLSVQNRVISPDPEPVPAITPEPDSDPKASSSKAPKSIQSVIQGVKTNLRPDQSENEKHHAGPGFLDAIPLFGSLIRAVQNHRFGFIAWFLFNLVVLGVIFDMVMDQNGFLTGALVYLAGLFLVTTPIGEVIVILQNGWKPLKPEQQLSRVEAVLERVYSQSKEKSCWLKKKPRLYYDETEYPNAYAFGRGSLCVTKGLLEYCTDDEILGILAHEMGHLAYRHPDESMIVHVGNIFISVFLVIIGIICNAVLAVVSNLLDNSRFFAAIGKGLNYFFSSIMVQAWYGLGNLFTRSSSIHEEYDADAYAAELGYAGQLCDALASIDNGSESASGSWTALMGDHPSTPDRILRLQGK